MIDLHVITRASNALEMVPQEARPDATRVVAAAQSHLNEDGSCHGACPELSRELGALVETLARRSARAMPYAALGRAVLASVKNDLRETIRLVDECGAKLALFGK